MQRAPFHNEEICCHYRDASGETSSSFSHHNPRQRNMAWNRTKWLFWQLAVGLSMIAVATGHAETAPVDANLDLEKEFVYARESSDQIFGDSFHPEKDRILQFGGLPQAPSGPPFSFPPIPASRPTPRPTAPVSTPSTPRPTNKPTLIPTPQPSKLSLNVSCEIVQSWSSKACTFFTTVSILFGFGTLGLPK